MSSQSEMGEISSPFLDRQLVVTTPLNTIIANFLVYGIYIAVFGICISTFRYPNNVAQDPRRTPKFYVWSTILLFILATILFAVYTWHYYHQVVFFYDMARTGDYEPFLAYLVHDVAKAARRGIVNSIQALINLTADLTLIHRCYIIWESRKIVALPLLFTTACNTCIGLIGGIFMALGDRDTSISSNRDLYLDGNKMGFSFEVVNAVVNSVVTILTGRIWFISRQVQRLYGGKTTLRVMNQTIVAIILESGLLYPLTIAISLIMVNVKDFKQSAPIDFSPIIYQVAGIAPTLVIARARAGYSFDNVDRMISTMQFPRQDIENQAQGQALPSPISVTTEETPSQSLSSVSRTL